MVLWFDVVILVGYEMFRQMIAEKMAERELAVKKEPSSETSNDASDSDSDDSDALNSLVKQLALLPVLGLIKMLADDSDDEDSPQKAAQKVCFTAKNIKNAVLTMFWISLTSMVLQFSKGDKVVMDQDVVRCQKLQKGHGEWVPGMQKVEDKETLIKQS